MKSSKSQVIMVEPIYFDIEYAINPYMTTATGELQKIDKSKAIREWTQLKNKFEELEIEVKVISGIKGFPDMVFAANQSFTFINPVNSKRTALMSHMRSIKRQGEVKYFEEWYKENGFEVEHLQSDLSFEGNGDALLHPNKNILWGGYGPRTDQDVYKEIRSRWNFEVLTLKLIRPEFYHLDTCFAILNESSVLIQSDAFEKRDLEKISSVFENVIEVDINENLSFFAANCFSANGRDIILQRGSDNLTKKLRSLGFRIHEVETSEFMKAGGSVFCLKMALPKVQR